MFAIIRDVAGLVFALLGAAVAKRTGVKSDRAIAEQIGVGKDTVRRARQSTGAYAPVDDEPRIGLDGKARRMPLRANDNDDDDEEGVPANKKSDDDAEPLGLELERSMERSRAPRIEHDLDNSRSPDPFDFQRERSMEMSRGIEHEAGRTAAHTSYLDDKREEEIKRAQEIKRSQEIIDLDLLMKQEPQPFLDTLREQLKDVKPLPRDLSRDRDRGMER
jgi:hypothetical protein